MRQVLHLRDRRQACAETLRGLTFQWNLCRCHCSLVQDGLVYDIPGKSCNHPQRFGFMNFHIITALQFVPPSIGPILLRFLDPFPNAQKAKWLTWHNTPHDGADLTDKTSWCQLVGLCRRSSGRPVFRPVFQVEDQYICPASYFRDPPTHKSISEFIQQCKIWDSRSMSSERFPSSFVS